MDWIDLLSELKQRNIHLSVHGEDILFQGPANGLTPELMLALKQQRQQLIVLLKTLGKKTSEINLNDAESAALTAAQKQRWAAAYMQASQISNHISLIIDIEGEISREKVSALLQKAVQRHDALRLRFRYAGSAIQQYLATEANPDWLTVCEEEDLQAQTEDFIARRFDLLTQPPHRALLVEQRQKPVRCIWCFHQLIMDGWSLSLLAADLLDLFSDAELETM
ncbi:MAG TPA: condensation domain-containing protein, partial [Pseudomonadales bacterium]|nr:condensation domain-containing protein [Pseudomonadales bacterium]